MRLSVLLPVYNEETTIELLVAKLLQVPSVTEIIAVNDGSSDRSGELLSQLLETSNGRLKVFQLDSNHGKGRAVLRALQEASGTHVIVQDGDLEYEPREIGSLVQRASRHPEEVIYGSRFLDESESVFPRNGHYAGNRVLTFLCNLASKGRLALTDMATCYKLLPRDLMLSLGLVENGFGLDPEITLKIAQQGRSIHEIPISYKGRSAKEGKKLRWSDGLVYLRCFWQYRVRE